MLDWSYMTDALYLDSDETRAQAQVVACEQTEDGLWAVELDRTIFHPQGGGQPSDLGTIGGIEVKKVIHTPDSILHLVIAPIHGEVELAVNPAIRALHSRLHSAGHIIGLVGDEFGWHATRGNHFPGESRVIFEPEKPENIQLIDKEAFEKSVQAIIDRALTRVTTYDGALRFVTWGNLTSYLCGGTHVENLRDIGKVLITKIKMKKGTISVSYEIYP